MTGRDIEYQELTLRFRDCSWELVERKKQAELAREAVPPVLFRLVEFMQDKAAFAMATVESGTAGRLFSRWAVTLPFFYPKRKAEDNAGRSPAGRESRGNVWHSALQSKV